MIESKRDSQFEKPELPVDSIGMFRGSMQSETAMAEELTEGRGGDSNSHYGSIAVIPAWMPESSARDGDMSVA